MKSSEEIIETLSTIQVCSSMAVVSVGAGVLPLGEEAKRWRGNEKMGLILKLIGGWGASHLACLYKEQQT